MRSENQKGKNPDKMSQKQSNKQESTFSNKILIFKFLPNYFYTNMYTNIPSVHTFLLAVGLLWSHRPAVWLRLFCCHKSKNKISQRLRSFPLHESSSGCRKIWISLRNSLEKFITMSPCFSFIFVKMLHEHLILSSAAVEKNEKMFWELITCKP